MGWEIAWHSGASSIRETTLEATKKPGSDKPCKTGKLLQSSES